MRGLIEHTKEQIKSFEKGSPEYDFCYAVLDLMLPASSNFDEDRFKAFLKACSKYNCVAMQTNVVSRDILIDAQKNPQNYRGLIIRISGFSAYFVALAPEVQNEIINRNFYKCN